MIRAVKKTWVAEEDKALLRLIDIHGLTNWSLIAASMESRTGKQCRERYFNHLQPNIKKGNWSEDEDQIIISMQAKIGNQWSAMTKYLPGRTDNAIKNRWHAIVKAQNQQDNLNISQSSSSSTSSSNQEHENNHGVNPSIFSFKIQPSSSDSRVSGTAFYGSQGTYVPHGSSMRNFTPFEPPSESDHDSSPFKPSQMPTQMNLVPAFDTLTSRVAEVTIPAAEAQYGKAAANANNVSLDFLSYFFEKELENKDLAPLATHRSDGGTGNGMLYMGDASVNTNTNENGNNGVGGTVGNGNEATGSSRNMNINNLNIPELNMANLKAGYEGGDENNTGLVFDFSRVSLDFSLDDCTAATGEYDIALPSPINYKNLTVSVPAADDYSYVNVPLSLRPRTPRSPVLLNLKRSRF